MIELEMPRLGVVSNSDLNRHVLKNLLMDAGYCITVSCHSNKLLSHIDNDQLDAWLLDLDDEQSDDALEILTEGSMLPLLVNDTIPPPQQSDDFDDWRKRLLEKLEVIAVRRSEGEVATDATIWAAHVWVLGASLGGPEAVSEFLNALQPDLPIAMVYAQHIDQTFDKLLTGIGRNSAYQVTLAHGEQRLLPGQLLVVPADRQVKFLPQGRVVSTRKPWVGQFQPAIDQVVAELAREYRQQFGTIIFSGTCNDGQIGCRVAKACGGTIWAQSPASCVSDAMVQAAMDTGGVSYQGTPAELANALSERFSHEKRRVNIEGLHHERRATDPQQD